MIVSMGLFSTLRYLVINYKYHSPTSHTFQAYQQIIRAWVILVVQKRPVRDRQIMPIILRVFIVFFSNFYPEESSVVLSFQHQNQFIITVQIFLTQLEKGDVPYVTNVPYVTPNISLCPKSLIVVHIVSGVSGHNYCVQFVLNDHFLILKITRGFASVNIYSPRVNKSYIQREGMEYLLFIPYLPYKF